MKNIPIGTIASIKYFEEGGREKVETAIYQEKANDKGEFEWKFIGKGSSFFSNKSKKFVTRTKHSKAIKSITIIAAHICHHCNGVGEKNLSTANDFIDTCNHCLGTGYLEEDKPQTKDEVKTAKLQFKEHRKQNPITKLKGFTFVGSK